MSQSGRTRGARPVGAPGAPPAPVWSQCAICWGQRRIWEPEEAPNGEGRVLVARGCAECLGLGEVMRS